MAVPGDPDGLCRWHRKAVNEDHTVYLQDGRTLPELVDAEVITLPVLSSLPGSTSHPMHVFDGDDTPSARREQVRMARDRLLMATLKVVAQAERLIDDPRTAPGLKLRAGELVMNFAHRTGLLVEVQESEEERNIDAEILAIADALAGERPEPETREAKEDQLLRLARELDYEIEEAV
jgi:hypothetical protein